MEKSSSSIPPIMKRDKDEFNLEKGMIEGFICMHTQDPKNPKFISLIAYQYENGKGVPQDINQAIEWNLKGAELNDFQCWWNLGRLYSKYKNDKSKENHYFQLAADSDPKKMNFLARGKLIFPVFKHRFDLETI